MNDYEINRLSYKKAILYDKRTFIQYYWSILKKGHMLLFAFIPNNDYNSMILKICLFLLSFGLFYTVNALFFSDSSIHKIYYNEGKYDFIYQIPKIIYSTIISSAINLLMKTLSLTEKNIISLKDNIKSNKLEQNIYNLKKCLTIKFVLFFILSYIFLFIFWIYVSTFCAVYRIDATYLFDDTIISFGLGLLYPFGYYLIPGIFRIYALKDKVKNRECIYKISKYIQPN